MASRMSFPSTKVREFKLYLLKKKAMESSRIRSLGLTYMIIHKKRSVQTSFFCHERSFFFDKKLVVQVSRSSV